MSDSGYDEGRSGLGRLNFFLGKVSIGVAMALAVNIWGPRVRCCGLSD